MFTEKQLERYADVLIWGVKTARTNKYKKGDIITVGYNLPAVKLAEIVFSKLVKMGINPIVRALRTPEMEKSFYEYSNNNQLVFQPPGEKKLVRNLHGGIYLLAPESLTHLSGVDPKKIGKSAISRKPIRNIQEKREEMGEFGWTLCMLPTDALVKHSGLTIKQYTNQIVKACFLNKTDPVAMWKDIFKNATRIKKWMNSMKVKKYHIESKNTDLMITPGKNRKWIGISGHNIPSFELFISPDWRGTEGKYFANLPSYQSGNYVKNLKLEFKNGSAVKIKAEEGENFSKKVLKMDTGASKLGEFSLTDTRFSKIDKFMANTLFDENFGGEQGNCHVALGASYSDTYDGDPSKLTKAKKKQLGFNDSALHWDIVNTEKKTITAHLANGKKKVVYENGKFKY